MLPSLAGILRSKMLVGLGAISICQLASAATICVNPAGGSGCQSTIAKGAAAAASGDTIQVAAGTYKETVTLTSGVALIGAGSGTTIIDANGLANGIVVDGTGGTGIRNVVISGFTVKSAKFQGILVENVSGITISSNQVLNNDTSLDVSGDMPACPGLPPALQAGEGEDCGEGLHLTGVDHAVVSNNVLQGNSGGILITDDLGPTHDNVITNNIVNNNPFDCGITIARRGRWCGHLRS